MAANIERLMAPGATLFVSVPFCWRVHGYPSDYWRMTPDGLLALFSTVDWRHRMIAADQLYEGPKFGTTKVDEHPYLARAETCGFAVMP
jgi:hypothetical protein